MTESSGEVSIKNLGFVDNRSTVKFRGQESSIGAILVKDRKEMTRYSQIEQSLPSDVFDKVGTDRELIEEAKSRQHGEREKYPKWKLAVIGDKGVPESERGELQGWINFYPNEEIQQLKEQGLIDPESNEIEVLEVSFADHPNAPKKQMASALRQACTMISRLNAGFNPDNLEEVKPSMIITTYVDSDDKDSINVLESAGFVNEGHAVFPDPLDPENPEEAEFYVLNWSKLNEKMHKVSDRELFSDQKSAD